MSKNTKHRTRLRSVNQSWAWFHAWHQHKSRPALHSPLPTGPRGQGCFCTLQSKRVSTPVSDLLCPTLVICACQLVLGYDCPNVACSTGSTVCQADTNQLALASQPTPAWQQHLRSTCDLRFSARPRHGGRSPQVKCVSVCRGSAVADGRSTSASLPPAGLHI